MQKHRACNPLSWGQGDTLLPTEHEKPLLFASSIQPREKDSSGGLNYGTCGFSRLLTVTRGSISFQATDLVSFPKASGSGVPHWGPCFLPFVSITLSPKLYSTLLAAGFLTSLPLIFRSSQLFFRHGLSSWKLPKWVDLQGQQHQVSVAEMKNWAAEGGRGHSGKVQLQIHIHRHGNFL